MTEDPEATVCTGVARALELILAAAIHQARADACDSEEDAFLHLLRAEIARRSAAGAATRAAERLQRD